MHQSTSVNYCHVYFNKFANTSELVKTWQSSEMKICSRSFQHNQRSVFLYKRAELSSSSETSVFQIHFVLQYGKSSNNKSSKNSFVFLTCQITDFMAFSNVFALASMRFFSRTIAFSKKI